MMVAALGGVEKLRCRVEGLKLCCQGAGKGVPLEATKHVILIKGFINETDRWPPVRDRGRLQEVVSGLAPWP